MSEPLILATPSKGRLKEQVESWLADCGLPLKGGGAGRGYSAQIDGLEGVQVRLASAADIAQGLASGELHLGVTGEDLLREQGDLASAGVVLLNPLGFGRADLVVAAPQSWVDVETMADVDDVAHAYLARTGRRIRVATKYLVQTRGFFARHGIVDYRLAESGGATEGAPAAGAAELIVDITTTGATLAANHLKPLTDGVILRSQAHLAASVRAAWDADRLGQASRLLAILEARARARDLVALAWPASQQAQAAAAISPWVSPVGNEGGCFTRRADLFAVAAGLAAAGVGPVSVSRPEYVFEAESSAARALGDQLGRQA